MAALADHEYLASIKAKVVRAREKIYAIAKANALKPIQSSTNFVAVDCRRDGAYARKIVDGLACTEPEKNELLGEAGRLDKEIEQIAKDTSNRPDLQTLFKSATQLDEKQLAEINEKIQSILNSIRKK